MKKTTLTIVFCAIMSSVVALARDTDSTSVQLQTVDVEGKQNLGRIQAVIEKEEIRHIAANSIDDLLDMIIGVDIRQRATNGVQADMSIRGGSFDQMLILLNGINVTDPQTGHFNLDVPLTVNDIERIEILQGSASRLLGTNGFAGAINIITTATENDQLSAGTETGSFGFFSQSLSAHLVKQNVQLFGTASQQLSKGYKDNTDFETGKFFLQAKYQHSLWGKHQLQVGGQEKAFGANSFYSLTFPNQYEKTRTFVTSYQWDKKTDSWGHILQTYWRRQYDRFELFRDFEGAEKFSWYQGHNYHQTDVMGAKWLTSYYWRGHKSTLGVEMRNEHIFSNKLGDDMQHKRDVPFEPNQFFTKEGNRRAVTLLFDQLFRINRWTVSMGVSLNHTKEYGLRPFGGIEINYQPAEYINLFTSFNSAVRLPTFTDLYYQSAYHKSNPDILPEKAHILELGGEFNTRRWHLLMSTYYRMGSNIIDAIKYPKQTVWETHNLTNVNAFGVDANAIYRFQHNYLQSVKLGYAYLLLDKKAEEFDSKYALDYLNHKITLGVRHRIYGQLGANWEIAHFVRSGDYTDIKSLKQTYAPYTLLDAKLYWEGKKMMLFADFKNILNSSYVDYGGLELPRFNLLLGLRITLDAPKR